MLRKQRQVDPPGLLVSYFVILGKFKACLKETRCTGPKEQYLSWLYYGFHINIQTCTHTYTHTPTRTLLDAKAWVSFSDVQYFVSFVICHMWMLGELKSAQGSMGQGKLQASVWSFLTPVLTSHLLLADFNVYKPQLKFVTAFISSIIS